MYPLPPSIFLITTHLFNQSRNEYIQKYNSFAQISIVTAMILTLFFIILICRTAVT